MCFFSIIIPSYNRGDFLPATLQSVLRQDYKDFEILLIDDGSTDNTGTIVKDIAATDARLNYFLKKNEERGAARNFGIKNAKGRFIIFLDSDDEFLPNHLSLLKKTIDENPTINFFASKFDFNENGNIFKSPVDRVPAGLIDYTLLKRGNPFACNVCIRKDNPALRYFLEDRAYSGMEDWIFLFANTWSQDMYLSNDTTVRMNEHPQRSMRFNSLIIAQRQKATEYLLKNFSLYKREKKKLKGYTALFCAIHAYLDNDRKQSARWLLKAIGLLGLRYDLLSLLTKLIFGRRIVGKIKEVIHHK